MHKYAQENGRKIYSSFDTRAKVWKRANVTLTYIHTYTNAHDERTKEYNYVHTMPRYNIAQRIMYIHLAYLHNLLLLLLLCCCCFVFDWADELFLSFNPVIEVCVCVHANLRFLLCNGLFYYFLNFSFVLFVGGCVCLSRCVCALSFYLFTFVIWSPLFCVLLMGITKWKHSVYTTLLLTFCEFVFWLFVCLLFWYLQCWWWWWWISLFV